MDVSGKNILVVGFGKSGLSATRYLLKAGAHVTINDIRFERDLDKEQVRQAREMGAGFKTGGHEVEDFVRSDMVVLSPGVPTNIHPVLEAKKNSISVLGELELASRFIKSPILAITGTNGKSTAITLMGQILEKAGMKYFLGGNLGTPLMDHVAGENDVDYVVLEVSSFQLDTMEEFNPLVAVLLNISPDHLDRYSNYEAYVKSKLSIFKNQGKGRFAVLNDDDERLSGFDMKTGVRILRYGFDRRDKVDAFIEDNRLVIDCPGIADMSLNLEDFHLPGRHNLENLMGVVLAASCIGIEKQAIEKALRSFRGLSHRIEFAGTVAGIDFYDDSKATNVDSAVKSIESFDRPVILIAGGKDKGGGYKPLVETAKRHVKKAILIGEAAPVMGKALEGSVPLSFSLGLEEAVFEAFSAAARGDVVLLAPACSSFDMFRDYVHRGIVFKNAVRKLSDGI